MITLSFLLSCLGWLASVLAMEKHFVVFFQRQAPSWGSWVFRGASAVLLGSALVPAVAVSGWSIGLVEWFGMLCIGCIPAVVLLTGRERDEPGKR